MLLNLVMMCSSAACLIVVAAMVRWLWVTMGFDDTPHIQDVNI
jgi:hypothetical protein